MNGVPPFRIQRNPSGPTFTQPFVNFKSVLEGEFDTRKFKEAFARISALGTMGIEVVYELCVKEINKEINENEIAKTLTRIGINVDLDIASLNEFITWLTRLNDYHMSKILHTIIDVRSKSELILASFKTRESRHKLVEVSRSTIAIGLSFYRVEASAGVIVLQNISDPDDRVQLMTDVQFLATCKKKLRGLNLSGLDLCELKELSHLDLMGTNFSQSNLSGVDFSGSNLSKARMCSAIMDRAIFVGADLRSVDARVASFIDADMRGANCGEANFYGAKLVRALLGRANFQLSTLNRASLAHADASWTNFQGANMNIAFLTSAYLGGANFSAADMSWSIMTNANLSRASFFGTVMAYALLKDVKLVDTKFDHATVFEETTFSLELSEDKSKHVVNDKSVHFCPTENARLFSTIRGISNRFGALKLVLAYKVMSSLKNIDISKVDDELLESLVSNPHE